MKEGNTEWWEEFRRLWPMEPADLLFEYGGFYRCPRREEPDGRITWLGPLAGYTSTDSQGRNRVGPEYANFRVFEEGSPGLHIVALKLIQNILFSLDPALKSEGIRVCGIPTGGRMMVEAMSHYSVIPCTWASKRTVGKATETTRARTEIYFKPEHVPQRGERYVLGEDVGNAFSTTADTIRLIESHGAHVDMLAFFLNRSIKYTDGFFPYGERRIPIVALWSEPMPLYDQDNPMVAAAVAADAWHLDTKKHWDKFMAAMEAAA